MTVEALTLQVAGHTVNGLRRRGQGTRVLALHGWLDNAASFVPLLPYVPDLDIVLLDLPGHGLSDHLSPGADYTPASAICHVLDVADSIGWERFTLLGHSLGAGIASMVAAVSGRVERLIAIEALGGLRGPEEQTAQRLREHVQARRHERPRPLRVFPTLTSPIRARMMLNQLSEPSARLLVERGVHAVEGGYSWRTDQRLMWPTAVRLTEGQIDDLLRAIACPVQVIYATPAQPYYPEPLRSERLRHLRDGRLAVLPGSHHVHMDAPEAVGTILTHFLGNACSG